MVAPAPPAPPSAGKPSNKGKTVPADVSAGFRLGKYEIVRRLAAGGMAEIFLARVSGLSGFQKMVVIKRILPQLATKSDFVEMFLDEARIAATLQHPNVVQMYDVGVVDGNYFIAMEYLHGEDVRSIMKTLYRQEGRLPVEQALNIIIGLASGLHYAHEKKGFDGKPLDIIHRDVTPQNIIVTYEGGVKLLDFGIAKASNRFGETRFGTLKGKVPYMSPEQCRGEPLDRRSDIFSLGIMLYELTLGRRLYKGHSDFEVLKQIVEGTVTRPTEIDPSYHPKLEEIVMRGLEKERDKRYQTAREMQTDLEALVREERFYVSPIALQGFMEQLFGQKIEAWRDAQAHGKSLGEHLEAVAAAIEIGEDEMEELDTAAAEEEERIKLEREEFRRKIKVVEKEDEVGTKAQRLPEPVPIGGTSLSSLHKLPTPRRWPLLAGAVGLGVLIGVVALVMRPRHVPLPPPVKPMVEKPAAPPPVVVKPMAPPAPPVAIAKPVGIAKIDTTPTGATLYLDGAKLPSLSPTTLDRIEAKKEHVLLVQLDGHKDALEKFTLGESEVRSLSIKLSHKPAEKVASHASSKHEDKKPDAAPTPPVKLEGEGTLLLASTPWANVSIDGESKGPTPIRVTLPAGKHTVVLTNPEFKINRTMPVMILPNETLRKRLDF
jgi:tRNA A-37 threonylcarbamoyl transferase component Bud32